MGYQFNQIDSDTWKDKIREYDYALLYMISEIILCKTQTLPEIEWEECLEARFFSENGEMHIFERENGMEAVMVKDSNEEDILVKEYKLNANAKYSAIGKIILVQEYLTYDEDGQAIVALTRLKGIK